MSVNFHVPSLCNWIALDVCHLGPMTHDLVIIDSMS